jgi:curli production assembly/transport component CsgE
MEELGGKLEKQVSRKSFCFRKWRTPAIAMVFFLSGMSVATAAENQGPAPKSVQPRQQAPELDAGFVTGHLVTVAGNNFFQYFIALWRDKPLSGRYSLTIHERPDALRGSVIKIDCLNRTIFSAILPNSHTDIKEFSARAVEMTYQNATQAEVQRLLFRDQDLATDEL